MDLTLDEAREQIAGVNNPPARKSKKLTRAEATAQRIKEIYDREKGGF